MLAVQTNRGALVMLPWWAYSLVASMSIALLEYTYRNATFASFWQGAYFVLPLNALVAYGLFHAYRGAPSFLFAWVFFFVCNMTLRLGVAQWALEEPISMVNLAGVALVFAGAALLR